MGEDWQEFFNLIVCEAQKPLFYKSEEPFKTIDKEPEKIKVTFQMRKAVKKWKILLHGNIKLLTLFLQEMKEDMNIKMAFFSDHLHKDLLSGYQYNYVLDQCSDDQANWDVVAIVKEFEQMKNIPSKKFWGDSFFLYKKEAKNFFVDDL